MNNLNIYREISKFSEVAGASNYQQIHLLIKKLEEDIHLAIQGIQTNDLTKKTSAFSNAADIVIYLRDCLSMESGGELAEKLYNIYTHLEYELFFSQVENNIEKLKKCQIIVGNIKTWWDNIQNECIEN